MRKTLEVLHEGKPELGELGNNSLPGRVRVSVDQRSTERTANRQGKSEQKPSIAVDADSHRREIGDGYEY